jgi:hypothetical protein
MGLEFITAKARHFRKMYDGGRARLDTADLLISDEAWEDQLVLFDVLNGHAVIEGEELLIQASGPSLIASRDHDAVATATNPPPTVVNAILKAHGYVVARVVRYAPISNTADLAFRFQR